MLYDFMFYYIILLYYIIMISSYLKYSRYTPEVLEYFFWNIFVECFGIFLARGIWYPPSDYTWNIFGLELPIYLEYFWIYFFWLSDIFGHEISCSMQKAAILAPESFKVKAAWYDSVVLLTEGLKFGLYNPTVMLAETLPCQQKDWATQFFPPAARVSQNSKLARMPGQVAATSPETGQNMPKHMTTKCFLPFLTPSHAGSLQAHEKKMEVKMEEILAQPIRSHT